MKRTILLVAVLAMAAAACADTTGTTVTTTPTRGTVTTATTPGTTGPSTTTSPEPSTTTTAPATTTAPTTTTTATTPPPSFDGGTDPFEGDGTGYGLLTDVRLAAQDGFDRLVFEFSTEGPADFEVTPGIPGHRLSYSEPPFFNVPGNFVPAAGTAFLYVNMFAARAFDFEGEEFVETYLGPGRVRSDTRNVVEAVFVTDFEATMEWIVGLDRAAPFRVTTLDDPPRLVVDIAADPDAAPAWGRSDRVTGGGTGFGWLTDVRLAAQDGFDRFVLEFSPDYQASFEAPAGLPDYDVGYAAGPFPATDGSGTVAGDRFVFVDLPGSGRTDSGADFSTYDGPTVVTGDTDNVVEARLVNEDAGLQWVLGVARDTPIRVYMLEAPPRLVVEVDH